MNKIKLLIFSALLSISAGIPAMSQGLQHLNIAPSAFSLSRAEATTSVFDGSSSMFINPALLSMGSTSTIDLTYTSWIADVNGIFGGINFLNGRNAFALSFYSMGSGDFQQRDQPGPSNGSFTVRYLSFAGSYSRDFKWFSAGITAQYLYEEIFLFQASGYAFSFGLAKEFLDGKIRTGASLTNLGKMQELDVRPTELPTNLRLGISADILELSAKKNSELPILITAFADLINPVDENNRTDFTELNSSEAYFNLGLSAEIAETVQISSGYKTQNNVRPWSFGAGFITEQLNFNYSLIPFNTGYGTVHSIGLQYKF